MKTAHAKYYLSQNDWLLTANTFRASLPRVSGCRAIVWFSQIAWQAWAVAIETGGPAVGSISRELPMMYPNRHNAILAGLIAMRDHWRQRGVESIAADLQDAIDELF